MRNRIDSAVVREDSPEAEALDSTTHCDRGSGRFAQDRRDLVPRVLIALPEYPGRAALLRVLHDVSRVVLQAVEPTAQHDSDLLRAENVDVAVLHAGRLNSNYSALIHDPDFGFPEIVFVVDDACSAQRLALLSRGYRHVISDDRLLEWLPGELDSLSTLARARRIVLGACPAKPSVADLALGKAASRSMNLHVAETNFREVFLRALLTEHGSRRRAAEAAGVPYRSFCEMLRKLGI